MKFACGARLEAGMLCADDARLKAGATRALNSRMEYFSHRNTHERESGGFAI